MTGPLPYRIPPGIQRDSTILDSDACVDGQWTEWQYGRCQKIGGYNELQKNLTGPIRGTGSANLNNFTYTTFGSAGQLEQVALDQTGGAGSLENRTPAGPFASNPNNLWMFDSMYNSVGTNQVVIAHAGQNLNDLSSSVDTEIFYGQVGDTGPLADTTAPAVSGGIVCIHPYLFAYGNDGLVAWSVPNNPTDFTGTGSGEARISGQKVIKGVMVRGGSANSPAGLFWSLDSLSRVSFTGGSTIFRNDFVGNASLLSTRCVIEYDGLYFFISTHKFNVYNGTLQEVPNSRNKDYFFQNLNWTQRQKVWGTAIPQYNEIWWFWPKGSATECTNYLIYNILEKEWYDGELERGDGINDKIFRWPLMVDSIENSEGDYSLWQHEFGVDRISNQTTAIRSYVETPVIQKATTNPTGDGEWMNLDYFEPDFDQVGDMSITITGRLAANSEDVTDSPIDFAQDQTRVEIRQQRRQMRLIFESNVKGGYYKSGQHWLHTVPGDKDLPLDE